MSTAFWSLVFLQVFSTMTNWWSALAHKRRTYATSKVLVMLIWVLIFILLGGTQGEGIWFFLALIFSLVGDIFLLLSMRIFIYGLAAFLLSHICYLIGFNQVLPSWQQTLVGTCFIILIVLAIGLPIAKRAAGKPELKKFSVPIMVYSFVLAAMTVTAVMSLFKSEWSGGPAWLAASGGLLFLVSDIMLAIQRFVHRFPAAPVLIIMTYHLAQFSLVLSYLWRTGLLTV